MVSQLKKLWDLFIKKQQRNLFVKHKILHIHNIDRYFEVKMHCHYTDLNTKIREFGEEILLTRNDFYLRLY